MPASRSTGYYGFKVIGTLKLLSGLIAVDRRPDGPLAFSLMTRAPNWSEPSLTSASTRKTT